MRSAIRLFKAVPVESKEEKEVTDRHMELVERTIPLGFIFSPEVVSYHNDAEIERLIDIIKSEFGITAEQMNASFHKSWKKVKDANIVQLVLEQITHYFTTYGFEALGVYDKDSIYVPAEKLDIPETDIRGFKFVTIKGYTNEELEKKLMKLLNSGIALKDETIKDVCDIFTYLELDEDELTSVKNREVRAALYDYLNLIPTDPTEFLRYCIYRVTGSTLLIKSDDLISEIKDANKLPVLGLFTKYKNDAGLERLAEIFYRFKPIFLAFKGHTQMNTFINKVRKLAKKYHRPMKGDYLNEVTERIEDGTFSVVKLLRELKRVNTFRKIRLAYALKFRTKDVCSIMYKIRNGKAWAEEFDYDNREKAGIILNIVLETIAKDLKKNVEGRKIYIPEYISYALPATEKQFTGFLPSGSCITVPEDMVLGVHWGNLGKRKFVDLDLSLVSSEGKFGWDGSYRSGDRRILFSGDMTSAPEPDGATELFYVRKNHPTKHLVMLNYYNFNEDNEVPYKIIVGKENIKHLDENYVVNPNNVILTEDSNISQRQKIIGLLVVDKDKCRFYFTETAIGMSITSFSSEYSQRARDYLFDFYTDTISLEEVLEKAGAEIVRDKKEYDIDLSPEDLEKDTILDLITGDYNG